MWRVNNGLAINDEEEKKILDTLNKYKEYFKKEKEVLNRVYNVIVGGINNGQRI